MKKVECIIMDWAGTSVDYGCMAPVAAFVESFKNIGLEVTPEETRAFMGLTKIEEIRALFAIERVAEDFRLKFGRDYDDSDVQGRYNDFQRVLLIIRNLFPASSKPLCSCGVRASRLARQPDIPKR